MATWVCTYIDCRLDHNSGEAFTTVEFADSKQMKKFAKGLKSKKKMVDRSMPKDHRSHLTLQLVGNEATAFEVGQSYNSADIEAWL